MKKRSEKRGLFVRQQRIAENADEVIQIADELSRDVDPYIEKAEQFSRRKVSRAGIDTKQNPHGYVPQLEEVDRAALSLEVDEAIDVLFCCRTARRALEEKDSRDALRQGIRLAEAIGRLDANLAWRKDIETRRKQDLGLAKNRPRGRPAVKKQKILEAAKRYPKDRHQSARVAKATNSDPSYVRKILNQK